MNRKVLIVDDEPELRDIFKQVLESYGFEAFGASSGREAISVVSQESIEAIISDVRMADGNGLDFLDYIRNISGENLLFILMTGFSDIHPEQAYDRGASALLKKPMEPEAVVQCLNQLLRLSKISQKLRPPRYATSLSVLLQDTGKADEQKGQIQNISRSGFLVSVDELSMNLNEETQFKILFKNNSDALEGRCTLRRISYPTKFQKDHQAGFEICDMSETSKEMLFKLLRQLEDNLIPII